MKKTISLATNTVLLDSSKIGFQSNRYTEYEFMSQDTFKTKAEPPKKVSYLNHETGKQEEFYHSKYDMNFELSTV